MGEELLLTLIEEELLLTLIDEEVLEDVKTKDKSRENR